MVGRAVAGGGGGRVAQVAEAAAAGAKNELGGGADARRRRGAKEDRGDYWLFHFSLGWNFTEYMALPMGGGGDWGCTR